jgi:hypothetical protein
MWTKIAGRPRATERKVVRAASRLQAAAEGQAACLVAEDGQAACLVAEDGQAACLAVAE